MFRTCFVRLRTASYPLALEETKADPAERADAAEDFFDQVRREAYRQMQEELGAQIWIAAVKAAIGSIDVGVSMPAAAGPTLTADMPYRALGGGAQRALAIAALSTYRDAGLWDPLRMLTMLVEEPEVGLHPALQRRVADALGGLATFGVQTLVVSHAPPFVNAAPTDGIRIVRRHQVLVPEGLGEIASELGATPADLLLGSRIVVVEGASDRDILGRWAATIGLNLDGVGVRLFPCEGHGAARIAVRLLRLAYAETPLWVVLDGGRREQRRRQS